MKPFVRRYEVQPYGSALYVVFCATLADGVIALPAEFQDNKTAMEGCDALTLYRTAHNSIAVLFMVDAGETVSHRSIAHEAFHATDCILENVGIAIRRHDANEAGAYLCGWIAEKVYDAAGKYARSQKRKQKET